MNALAPHAHWLLRLSLISVAGYHGLGKIPNMAGFAEMMGLPLVVVAAVTFAEVAAAIGYVIGGFGRELFTRLASLALIPVLIGAIVLVHGPRWSFVPADGYPMGGMEFQVVLLFVSVYFLIVGNGSSGGASR